MWRHECDIQCVGRLSCQTSFAHALSKNIFTGNNYSDLAALSNGGANVRGESFLLKQVMMLMASYHFLHSFVIRRIGHI